MKLNTIETTIGDYKIVYNKRKFEISKHSKFVCEFSFKKGIDILNDRDAIYKFIVKIYEDTNDVKAIQNLADDLHRFYSGNFKQIYFRFVEKLLLLENVTEIPSTNIELYSTDEDGRKMDFITYYKVTPDLFINERGLKFNGTIYDMFLLKPASVWKTINEYLKKNFNNSWYWDWKFVSDEDIKNKILARKKEKENISKKIKEMETYLNS